MSREAPELSREAPELGSDGGSDSGKNPRKRPRRISPLLSRNSGTPLKHDLKPLTPLSSAVRMLLMAAGLAAIGIFAGVYVLVMVLCLVGMLFFHELGHYLTAKWAGMKVSQFFLGFGPRIWSYKKGETTYGVKPILIGAYVRILGMNNLEKVDPSEEHLTYRSKPYWRRMSVAVAGSGMHFLMAILLFWILHSTMGFNGINPPSVVEIPDWQIGRVLAESSAEEIGLQTGDKVVEIGGKQVRTFNDLRDEVVTMPGELTELKVVRDGSQILLTGTIGVVEGDPGAGFLGVGPSRPPPQRQNPIFGLGNSLVDFGKVTAESAKGIAALFSLDGLDGLLGPLANFGGDTEVISTPGGDGVDPNRAISVVGILDLGSLFAQDGPETFLVFLASLNIFFGVLNLLPMLPLDGGHVAIATYERLRSRRGRRYVADVGKMLPVVYIFLLFLLTVSVVALSRDILDPIDLSLN